MTKKNIYVGSMLFRSRKKAKSFAKETIAGHRRAKITIRSVNTKQQKYYLPDFLRTKQKQWSVTIHKQTKYSGTQHRKGRKYRVSKRII